MLKQFMNISKTSLYQGIYYSERASYVHESQSEPRLALVCFQHRTHADYKRITN